MDEQKNISISWRDAIEMSENSNIRNSEENYNKNLSSSVEDFHIAWRTPTAFSEQVLDAKEDKQPRTYLRKRSVKYKKYISINNVKEENTDKITFKTNSIKNGCFQPCVSIFSDDIDPYVSLIFIATKKMRQTNPIYRVKQHAKWLSDHDRNRFRFRYPKRFGRDHIQHNAKLLLEVWNHQYHRQDQFISSRVVDLQFAIENPHQKMILTVKMRNGFKFAGYLDIAVKYIPPNIKTMSQLLDTLHLKNNKYESIKEEEELSSDDEIITGILKQKLMTIEQPINHTTKKIGLNFLNKMRKNKQRHDYGIIEMEVISLRFIPQNATHSESFKFKYRQIFCFLIFLILYIVIAAELFYLFEGWLFLDSVYFTAVTVSTSGYGDFYPVTNAGKIFACILILISTVLVLVVLTTMINTMTSSRISDFIHRYESRKRRKKLLVELGLEEDKCNAYDTMSMLTDDDEHLYINENNGDEQPSRDNTLTEFDTLHKKLRQRVVKFQPRQQERNIPELALNLCIFMVWTLMFAAFWYFYEEWSMLDSIYFAIVTASTVGYGDKIPTTKEGKIFTIVTVMFGVASLATVAASLSTFIQERNMKNHRNQILDMSLAAEEDLKEFGFLNSKNSDVHEITKFEFLVTMLKKMKLVRNEQIQQILDKFSELDVDGSGTITARDFAIHRNIHALHQSCVGERSDTRKNTEVVFKQKQTSLR